jgi:hypothetical protein
VDLQERDAIQPQRHQQQSAAAVLVAGQLDAGLAEDGIGDEPVVVIAHSASGLLLPLVPSFCPVAHLVYLAAGVPQPGMTLDEQLAADPDMLNLAWVGVDPFQDHQAARRFLFHDCDEATARWAIAAQTPWYPEGLYSERCPLEGFPPIPSTSIVCAGDRVIQPAWSRRIASDRLDAQVIELPGGHCPTCLARRCWPRPSSRPPADNPVAARSG